MTVNLPKDLERFVQNAVRAGLYPREDDVICDALTRLRQAMQGESARPVSQDKPMTEDELLKHMLDMSLITQLPDRDADFDDPDDQPIEIQGEPLSETIIRERR